ncbi:hypothetical protein FOVSG1_014549 [Fusarium oxysporum f. sp. vasinfectum]
MDGYHNELALENLPKPFYAIMHCRCHIYICLTRHCLSHNASPPAATIPLYPTSSLGLSNTNFLTDNGK